MNREKAKTSMKTPRHFKHYTFKYTGEILIQVFNIPNFADVIQKTNMCVG